MEKVRSSIQSYVIMFFAKEKRKALEFSEKENDFIYEMINYL